VSCGFENPTAGVSCGKANLTKQRFCNGCGGPIAASPRDAILTKDVRKMRKKRLSFAGRSHKFLINSSSIAAGDELPSYKARGTRKIFWDALAEDDPT
jgi:hypothetical protein